MSFLSSGEDVSFLQKKVSILFIIVLSFILIVLARLLYLQVFKGGDYRALSEQISIRESELKAKRGQILDRNGKVLADNRSYYEIVAIPQYLENREKAIQSLTKIIPISREEIVTRLYRARREPSFLPVVLVEDASYDWVAKTKEYFRPSYDTDTEVYLQGVEINKTFLRFYPYPELFSHVLGYLQEIDRKNLKKLKSEYPDHYSLGDLIGTSALEKTFDLELKGMDGVLARVVDARGREIRENPDLEDFKERASYDPHEGDTLITTLDYETQLAAAKALGDRRGAVVALDPTNGEVLALYSSPGFNANRIIKNVDKDYWRKINLHEDKYFFNRAVQAAYPPGSTYKIVGAFAALDREHITPKTRFRCRGGLKFGNRFFRCWRKGGHGLVDIIRGITQSCDVFFYNVGLKVGVDGLHHYANLLGLGKKTGIDLPFENPGLIPSSEWKMKRFKQPWIRSETLSIVIGQGYDLVTPLQNAVMISMIANGGRTIRPYIGKAVRDSETNKIKEIKNSPGEVVIPPDLLKKIQKGLIGVVHGHGTARRLRKSPYKIAGKTGTAQVIGSESRVARTSRTRDHAWFVAYAPYDDPKIAVSVLVENGGHGGAAAAPVAQAVIDTYLKKQSQVASR